MLLDVLESRIASWADTLSAVLSAAPMHHECGVRSSTNENRDRLAETGETGDPVGMEDGHLRRPPVMTQGPSDLM